VVRRTQGAWPAEDPLQPLEAMRRHELLAPMVERPALEGGQKKVVMIDATYLKAHRKALSLWQKRGPTTGAVVS
jgi:hypothetical protein